MPRVILDSLFHVAGPYALHFSLKRKHSSITIPDDSNTMEIKILLLVLMLVQRAHSAPWRRWSRRQSTEPPNTTSAPRQRPTVEARNVSTPPPPQQPNHDITTVPRSGDGNPLASPGHGRPLQQRISKFLAPLLSSHILPRAAAVWLGFITLMPNLMMSDSGTVEAHTAATLGSTASFLFALAGLLGSRRVFVLGLAFQVVPFTLLPIQLKQAMAMPFKHIVQIGVNVVAWVANHVLGYK